MGFVMGPLRDTIALLVAGTRLICYLTRLQLGAILPFITTELSLTAADQGALLSRYASGYCMTQILGGLCADRFGGYVVVVAVLLATTLCCLSAPVAIDYGIDVFGRVFFLLGFFQGAILPAGNVLIARWVLPAERSRASAWSGMGSCLGSIIISALAAPLADRFGWRAVFYACASITIAFTICFVRLAASSPALSTRMTEEEILALNDAGLLADIPSSPRSKEDGCCTASKDKETHHAAAALAPPRSFFMRGCVWTLFISHFVQNCQVYFTDWLPLFYNSYLSVGNDVAGLHLAAIAAVEFPARTLTKSLPEMLGKHGFSLLACRKLMSIQGFLGHLILHLVLAALLLKPGTSPVAFSLVYGMAKATQALHAGGYFANYLDLTRNYTGILTGLGNTIATGSGLAVPKFAAWSLEAYDGSWMPLVTMLLITDVVAMGVVWLGLSVECLDDVVAPPKARGADIAGQVSRAVNAGRVSHSVRHLAVRRVACASKV